MNKPDFTLPAVAIVLLTYQRTAYALETIQSARKNLIYGRPLYWIIADDGSDEAHFSAVYKAIEADEQGSGVTFSCFSEKLNYGGIANLAVEIANENGCPITFWLEDDWRTERPFDLTPYACLLAQDDDIGMVRLAHMPTGLEADTIGRHGRMYLHIKKTRQYAFSGNPHLKHFRFFEDYGMYPIGRNPGNTEVFYDHTVRTTEGCKIVWPLAIGDTYPFGHIGEVQSY